MKLWYHSTKDATSCCDALKDPQAERSSPTGSFNHGSWAGDWACNGGSLCGRGL